MSLFSLMFSAYGFCANNNNAHFRNFVSTDADDCVYCQIGSLLISAAAYDQHKQHAILFFAFFIHIINWHALCLNFKLFLIFRLFFVRTRCCQSCVYVNILWNGQRKVRIISSVHWVIPFWSSRSIITYCKGNFEWIIEDKQTKTTQRTC